MASLDDYLGDHNARYFGGGYGRVRQRTRSVTMAPDFNGLTGEVSLFYPTDWSTRKEGPPLTPHLTSIDALLIAADGAAAYSLARLGTSPAQLPSCRVLDVCLRASGAPDAVAGPIPFSVSAAEREPGATPSDKVAFHCRVGGMRIALALSYPEPVSHRESDFDLSTWLEREQGRQPARRPERTNLLRPRLVRLDLEGMSATCTTERDDQVAQLRKAGRRIASATATRATIIDNLVVASQLAQALLLETLGMKRHEAGTLWMRSASFSTGRAVYEDGDVCVGLTPVRYVGRPSPQWATTNVSLLGADGVTGSASLALALRD